MTATKYFTRKVPLLVRFLTLALLIGGLTGGIANFLLLDGFWPWEMPPLAHRFLAGAAAAYVVGTLFVFASGRWAESELLLATVVIYGVPLVAAILVQPHLIDWSTPVAWLFIGVVTPALIISTGYLLANWNRTESNSALDLAPRTYLLVLGVLTAIVGLLVFVVPERSGLLWPWAALDTWEPLDSRLVASMLLTIAGGALLAWWRNDRGMARLLLVMLTAYCVIAGTGLALHAAVEPAMLAANTIYIGIFSVVTLTGTLLFARR